MANGQTTMTIKKLIFAALLSGFALSVAAADQTAAPAASTTAAAAPAPAPEKPGLGTQYTDKGADTCLMCHVEGGDFPVFAIFKTPMGNPAVKGSPFAPGNLQCEACHGPGAKHAGTGDKNFINTFEADSFLTPQQRNKFCLACHQGGARMAWQGSVHQRNNLACTDCHKIHAEHDPVLTKATQPDVCYKCHKQQRMDFSKPSAHPVRFGEMTCTDCHSPHGSDNDFLLKKPTVNQLCYTCHAEKRGPFLWEHAPVAENCTLCHSPHGTVRPTLLKKSPPLLCQQCHSVNNDHANLAYTGAQLPGGSAGVSRYLLAGSCLNCHSQIHGSNSPAGDKLMR